MGINIKYRIALVFLSVTLIVSCNLEQRGNMERRLEMAEAMNRDYVMMDTLNGMNEVLDYFMAHGTTNERIRANYMMGCVYRDRGDSPMALEYYLNAVSLADTTDTAHCDFKQLSRIYGQMAILFHKQRYPQKEIEMWNAASSFSLKANDTITYLASYGKTAGVYYLLNDINTCLRIGIETYNKYKEIARYDLAAGYSIIMIDCYLRKDSLDKAFKLINEYINYSGFVDTNGEVVPGYEIFYYYMGQYFEKSGNINNALKYYKKLEQTSQSYMNLEISFKGQMAIFKALGKADSVFKYAQLFADANDSANTKHSADEVSRVQSLYDYTEHQKEAAVKTKEANFLWSMIIVGCLSFCIIAILVGIYIRQQKTKNQNKIIELNSNYNNILKNYHNTLSEYNSYKADKSSYEKELKIKLQELQTCLSSYQEDFDAEKYQEESSILQQQIVELFHSHAIKIKNPTVKEWGLLMIKVKEKLPFFLQRLYEMDNTLSEQEIKVCVLTRLNFIPSEICILMDLSKQRVSNLRRKLNYKLFKGNGTRQFNANIHRI